MKKPLYINGKCRYQIKNRYIPILLLICYTLASLITIPMHTIVSADYSLSIVQWEDWYPDETEGENDYIHWESFDQETAEYKYETSKVVTKTGWTGYNMLYMGSSGRTYYNGANVWMNFTDGTKNYTDYNTWCYGVTCKVQDAWGYDTDDAYLYMCMYNSTNVLVQGSRVMFEAWDTVTGSGSFKPQVFTNDGWVTIAHLSYSLTTETKFWINTTFVGGVTFNTSCFTSYNNSYIGETISKAWDYTPNVWNSSSIYQPTYIKCWLTHTGDRTYGDMCWAWVDDIILSPDIESDWAFIYGDEGTGDNDCYDILDTYIQTGIDVTGTTSYNQNMKNLQHIYNVYTTGELKAVSIGIDSQMYAEYDDLSDYTCSILGDTPISASCFQPMYPNYRVIWFCDYDLGEPIPNQQSGMMLYANFYFTNELTGNPNVYFAPCIANGDEDLDNDGDTTFRYGDDVNDWVPNNNYGADLGVSYWLESPYEPPDVEYNDDIFLSGYDGQNETGFIFYMDNPNGMSIGYTTGNSTGYLYSIYMEKEDSGSVDMEWYNIEKPSGEVYWNGQSNIFDTEKTVGKYNFTLTQDMRIEETPVEVKDYVIGYFVNRTTDTPYENYYVESRPSTTKPYEDYEIFYNYNNPFGYDGYIGVFEDFTDRNDFDEAYYKSGALLDNSTGTIQFSYSIAVENEYITLFIKEGTSYLPVAYCTHYIENPSANWNEIYVNKATLSINRGNPEQLNVIIGGTHVYPQAKVSIFINGIEWSSVQYDQYFSKPYIPTIAKQYVATLEVWDGNNDEWTELDSCTFNVIYSDDDGDGDGDDDTPPIDVGLEPPVSYIVGIIITIILMMIPILATKGSNVDGLVIGIASIVCACLGLAISILLGYLPAWTFAVIIVIVALVILVMWLRGRSGD